MTQNLFIEVWLLYKYSAQISNTIDSLIIIISLFISLFQNFTVALLEPMFNLCNVACFLLFSLYIFF